MFSQKPASGNPHRVAVVIPYRSKDDDRWVDFAGRKLAERFGKAYASPGVAGWTTDDDAVVAPVIVVHAFTPTLSDLDLTILFGIGYQVHEALQRDGVAVLVDGDIITY